MTTSVVSYISGIVSDLSGLISPINAQTGTTYTVVAADSGKTITFNNASAITVTLPQQSTIGTSAGFWFRFLNIGAGAVTFVKEGSDTLAGNTLANQYAGGTISRQTTTSWSVQGGTATVVEQFTVAFVNTLVNDKVYDIVVPNFSGTILGLSLRNTSAGTAGTYTAKINSTTITGLSAIANTTTRTLTAATAANTFVSGDVISYTPTGITTVVDAFITVYYTRVY